MSTFLSLGTGSEGLKQRLVSPKWIPQVCFSGSLYLLIFQKKYMEFCSTQMFAHIKSFRKCLSFFSLSVLIPTLFEIFLSCFCFVQLSESRAVSFVASFDETCTSPHPAALRISVLSCFLVSLHSVLCCFTESAAEEPDMSVRILFSWFALLFLKGEDANHDFFSGLVAFLSTWGCPLVLHTTVFDCSSFIRTKWVK